MNEQNEERQIVRLSRGRPLTAEEAEYVRRAREEVEADRGERGAEPRGTAGEPVWVSVTEDELRAWLLALETYAALPVESREARTADAIGCVIAGIRRRMMLAGWGREAREAAAAAEREVAVDHAEESR